MFVHSEKFVTEHQGRINDISIYGQESNQTTWRLCKMNLAIRGIDSSQVKWNNEGSFLKDAHKDLKADYIIANPPFNDSDWSGELLRKDGRWKFGVPSSNNANFAWIQHFLYHLAPNGKAAIVMHCGAASNKGQTESLIRKNIVTDGFVDCIISLPTQLFTNTTLPVHIWIFNRARKEKRSDILMIDAYNVEGIMKETTVRELKYNEITYIAKTYHGWKNKDSYTDIPGFCRSVHFEDVESKSFIIAPNRYIERIKKYREKPFNKNIEKFSDSSIRFSQEIVDRIAATNLNSKSFKINLLNNFNKKFNKNDWEEIEVSEVIAKIISGNWGNDEPKKENIPVIVIRGTDLPNIPLFNLKKTPRRFIHQDKVEEIQLKENDLIIELSGGSKDQPTGRCAIVTNELLEYFDYPLICSNFCKVIRVNTDKINPNWFYFYWNQLYQDGLTTKYENQPSGIKNFQLDEFITSELILLPPRPLQDSYSKYLNEIFEIKNKLSYTNYNLSKILDITFENIYYDFNEEDNIELLKK